MLKLVTFTKFSPAWAAGGRPQNNCMGEVFPSPIYGWLVVIEISATWFQPARSGSHLYSAPLYPVRSRTLSSRSYMTLVGQPLLSDCLASLFCILIISHYWWFVKTFFSKEDGSSGRQLQPLQAQRWGNLFCILIISQVFRLVKGFFDFFWEASGFEPPSVPPKFVMRSWTALHPGACQVPLFVSVLYHR